VEIESTLTRKTYIKLTVLLILRSSSFYFMIAIIFAFLLASFLSDSLLTYAIVILAVTILFYTLWILYNVSSKKNRNWFLKKHFTFSDENIIVKTSIVEQTIHWDAFNKWEKVAGYYLLHFSNNNWCAVGKSDIPASEIPSFETLLRQKIDKIIITKQTERN
jgi:hypothetical protein